MLQFKDLAIEISLFKPLTNGKILDLTKLKAFADDRFNIAKLRISLFAQSRKHCGKRRKCWFSKYFFSRVAKSQDCVIKSLLPQNNDL